MEVASIKTSVKDHDDPYTVRNSFEIAEPTTTVNVVESDPNLSGQEPKPNGLDRNAFSPLTAFGLAFSVINSWVVLVVGLGSGLVSGGPSACRCTK